MLREGGPALDEEIQMAWILLIFAGLLEIVWAYYMKQSQGFTKVVPSIITLVAILISFALLSIAMKTLPLGTSYTIWTGIGAIGAFLVGIFILGEQASLLRMTKLALDVCFSIFLGAEERFAKLGQPVQFTTLLV
jgi:quaternary ammonium compound-resistance protein SugE